MRRLTDMTRRQAGGALLGAATALAAGPRAAAVDAVAVTHEVRIAGFSFLPAALTIRVGDKVRWVNADIAPHTATALDESWTTEALSQGDSDAVRFGKPGAHPYVCAFHPHMSGRIEVVAHSQETSL